MARLPFVLNSPTRRRNKSEQHLGNRIGRAIGQSVRRKLKPPGHNAWYGNVLVQIFPSKSIAVEFQGYFLQLLLRGIAKPREAIRREPDDTAVRQFQKHHPPLNPNSHRGGLCCGNTFNDGGTHDTNEMDQSVLCETILPQIGG